MIRYHEPFWSREMTQAVFEKMMNDPFKAYEEKASRLKAHFMSQSGYSFVKHLFFTGSATSALEIMAIAMDIKSGDEIILPAFTHVSTANAFAKRGATLRFADIEMETLNMDPSHVEVLMNRKTRAVIPIHYGGVPAAIDRLSDICRAGGARLIEDASHGIGAQFKGRSLGLHGTMGCLSFHQTKNLTSGGNGGCLFVSEESEAQLVERILFHGTNRADFKRGMAKAYEWKSLGSEYEMPAYQMTCLETALPHLTNLTERRKEIWNQYKALLKDIAEELGIRIAERDSDNGHIFYLILGKNMDREAFQRALYDEGVETSWHYQPLHQSEFITLNKESNQHLKLEVTEFVADKIVRLPSHHQMTEADVLKIVDIITRYFRK